MFKQYSPLLDYPLQRIIIMILLKEDTQRALAYSRRIINELKDIPVDCFAYKKMTVTRTSDSRTKICFVTSDQTA